MAINQEQFNIKQALIDSAQSYFKLLNCDIIIKSTNFVQSDSYILKFFKTNFLHLTGLKTSLSTEDFFLKCYAGTIIESDYSLGPNNDRKTVKRKLKNLISIGDFFKNRFHLRKIGSLY